MNSDFISYILKQCTLHLFRKREERIWLHTSILNFYLNVLQSPDYIWSEEYQVTYLSNHFQVFDSLRKEGYFIGELIWNFADFKTAQSKYRIILEDFSHIHYG